MMGGGRERSHICRVYTSTADPDKHANTSTVHGDVVC